MTNAKSLEDEEERTEPEQTQKQHVAGHLRRAEGQHRGPGGNYQRKTAVHYTSLRPFSKSVAICGITSASTSRAKRPA